MMLFTDYASNIKKDLRDGSNRLRVSKNLDEIMDLMSFFQTFHDLSFVLDSESRELVFSLLEQRNTFYKHLAIKKYNAFYSKNLQNLENHSFLIQRIIEQIQNRFSSLGSSLESDATKEQFTDDEMYSFLVSYFQQYDLTALAIFQNLLQSQRIINVSYPEDDCLSTLGCTLGSSSLKKYYIFLENHHDFRTMEELVHEIGHVKDYIQNDQFYLPNDFVELRAKYDQKKFLTFCMQKKEYYREALSAYYSNYYFLSYEADQLSSFSLEGHQQEGLYYLHSILGDLFSDLLLSSSFSSFYHIKSYLSSKQNSYFCGGDLLQLGCSPESLVKKAEEQFQKYIKRK